MKKFIHINTIEITAGVIAFIGIVYFGWESPETRTKITELWLSGFWGLMTFSTISSYRDWKNVHWFRKILPIAAPVISVLYLFKYFVGF